MKNKLSPLGKQTVIAVLVVTILLLITTSLYLNAYFKSDQANEIIHSGRSLLITPEVIVAISVIILGFLAVIIVYLKKTRRSKNVNKLNEKYIVVFEQIEEYVGLSPLSLFEKREITGEVLALFLEAQENGKMPEEVIGVDYNNFIDNMIYAYGVNNNIVNDLLTGLQFYIVYLMIVTTLFFFEGKNTFFNIKIEYTLMFFFAIASFVIIPISFSGKRKALSKKNNISNLPYYIAIISGIGIAVLFIFTMEILRANFINITWIKEFLDGGMVIIKSPVHLIAILSIIPIVHVIKKGIRNSR